MRSIAIVLMFTLGATVAFAQDPGGAGWEASFAPAATASHVARGMKKLIVVRGGPPSDTLTAAGTALVAALRAAKRFDLVMDDAALGDVSAMSDSAIVAQTKSAPVEGIVVLRVFGEAPDATAVVTLFDADGKPAGAFTVALGKVVEPAAGSGADEGVSSEAVGSVGETVDEEAPKAERARERSRKERKRDRDVYDAEYVGYDEVAVVNKQTGAVKRAWPLFYKGENREPLEGADFYHAVGRDDLAESYDRRLITRWSLIIGGGAVAIGGLSLWLAEDLAELETCEGNSIDCAASGDGNESSGLKPLWIGATLVGTAACTIGFFISPQPVSASTARGLADQYNEGLQERLDLDASRAGRRYVRLAPQAGPGGGGLLLEGSF